MAYFGLTGGVASGKSTAARMFEDLGAKIIDADRIGHELLGSSLSAYQEIVHRFGDEILDSVGEIDRKQLGALVFADPRKLEELNAIVHPKIIARVQQLAEERAAVNPRDVILVDADRFEEDDVMLAAIDAGADDVIDDGEEWRVTTPPSVVDAVRGALEGAGIEVTSAEPPR